MALDRTVVVRGLLFVGVFAYMQGGAMYHQLFNQRLAFGTMTWRMYNGAARDICDVTFIKHTDDEVVEVDRFEVLEQVPWYEAPRTTRLVKSPDEVHRVGRNMCRKLPRGSTLSATFRCAGRQGWKRLHKDEHICGGAERSLAPQRPQGKTGEKSRK